MDALRSQYVLEDAAGNLTSLQESVIAWANDIDDVKVAQVVTWIRLCVETSGKYLPSTSHAGFLVSYLVALLSFPFLMSMALYVVWSLARVGPARKTMSTILIVSLGSLCYPLLSGALLGIVWIIAAFIEIASSVLLPLFLMGFTWQALFRFRSLELERLEALERKSDRARTSDILGVLALGFLSACTFGLTSAGMVLCFARDIAPVKDFLMVLHSYLPNSALVGFAMSFFAALLCLPLGICILLRVFGAQLWRFKKLPVLQGSEPVLSTAVLFTFGIPAYVTLSAIVSAVLWTSLGILAVALVIFGPVVVAIILWAVIISASSEFVYEQRTHPGMTEDISCYMIVIGLGIGIISLCTFGVVTLALTLLKAPLVVVASIMWAWCIFANEWLIFVGCRARVRSESSESSDISDFSEDDQLSTSCTCWMWWWFPLALLAFLFVLVAMVCVIVVGIVVSVLIKLIAMVVWPTYVSSGWLRYFGGPGGRRTGGTMLSPIIQGAKAGYQVLWASDLLTNGFITWKLDLVRQAMEEFLEVAKGEREELSDECKMISILPPVVVGLFQDEWNITARAVAHALGTSTKAVDEAWTSLARQMIRNGRQAMADGLLTEDFILDMPPELFIGLPARVLLDTLERSEPGELRLASGIVVYLDSEPPRNAFAKELFNAFSLAKAALDAYQPSGSERELLQAFLLAGGGETSELPAKLAGCLKEFENLPHQTKAALNEVAKHLLAIAIQCGRQQAFKDKLQVVLEGLTTAEPSPILIEDLIPEGHVEAESFLPNGSSSESD